MESIKYIDRNSGELKTELVPAAGMMNWLYGSTLGKATLHLLMKRKFVSAIGGRYMNSRRSKKRIASFIKDFNIKMEDYLIADAKEYKHFNDFFFRKIDPSKRPIGEGIVSPADGKTLAFQTIDASQKFFIKGSEFNLQRFLGSNELANQYNGGAMIIVRLAPTDYHRYHFPADGIAGESKVIKGDYFSVSPIALRQSLEIFCQNKRTICKLKTTDYGEIIISEVGATMVGSILQTYNPTSEVKKGQEKGYFAFGGSTVVLLFEKDKIKLSQDLIDNTANGIETQVLMGQTIATH